MPALPVGLADFRAPTKGAPTLWHGRPARDRHGQDGRATIWLRLRRATLPGSAATYTEGAASRPPTAQGLADIGVQENEISTRVIAQGPLYGPFAVLRAGSAALLEMPQGRTAGPALHFPHGGFLPRRTQDNPNSHGPRRPNHGAVEKPFVR